jgi:hypothetical protein
MSPLNGRKFFFGFAAVIFVVAVVGFVVLRQASSRRFAMSIHSVPESSQADIVTLGKPILVRIDKRSAGRSPLLAYALLLDGNGRPLKSDAPPGSVDLHELVVRELPGGKRTEEALFPPLTEVPGQRLLAAIVIRLPEGQLAAAKPQLTAVLYPEQAAAAAPPATSGKRSRRTGLPAVFSRVLVLSRDLGGHAELAQVEVREKL